MNKGKKCKLTEAEKKEKIASALAKKKECEHRALLIVERLIEEVSSRESLRNDAKHLNQGYYSDIVTERSIAKLCGYPICDKPLGKPKNGTFHISLRDKKVYSTEDRAKFCSNICFKASSFLINQLDSSPLWLREEEADIDIRLLEELGPEQRSKLRISGKGEVVPFTNQAPLPPEGDLDKHVVIIEHDGDDIHIHSDDLVNSQPRLKPSILKKAPVKTVEKPGVNINLKNSPVIDMPQRKIELPPTKKPAPRVDVEKEDLGLVVRRTLSEWFTEATLRLIRGEVHQDSDDDDTADVKLDQLTADVHNLDIDQPPDSEFVVDPELVRETELFSNKFSAYMRGREVYEEHAKIKEKPVEEDDDENHPRLPLLDQHSQSVHRVRIVLDGVSRYLPPLLDYLSLPSRLVQEQLRELARTLKLSAHNITHSPTQWRLIALQLIFIISGKDETLQRLIGAKENQEHIRILLQELCLAPTYLTDTRSILVSTLSLTQQSMD